MRSFRASLPLIEAKLHPPVPRPGTVQRTRLVDLLVDESGPAIVSMIAPPGYGKTTLLAQWAARERRAVAWLTLDQLDNDPATLVSYLATAFDRIHPVDPSVVAGASGSGQRVIATAIPRLLSDLHHWRKPMVLILDDAHRLVDRTALDALGAFLHHRPPGLRIAIAGRTEPGLPLARLRAQRDLLELGADSLALDEVEAAALVAAAGYALSAEEVRTLTERTEGWATGIYLAALARRHGDGETDRIGGVSGRDHYIAAYLRSEFRHGLSDDDLTFLTRTAILEQVTPPVAEAIVRLPEAADRLRRLARENLLIEAIGPSESAYRYHNLLRDFLLAELERREPAAASELHRRAARWYASAGEPDRSIEHLIASGDVDAAARSVTAHAVQMYYQGQVATVLRWLAQFEAGDFDRNPPLAVISAWMNLLTGRPEVADRMADITDRATFDGPTPDGASSFESQRAILRAVMARHGPRDVLANATLGVSREGPASPWRANALASLGAANLLLGDMAAADACYAKAVLTGGSAAAATTMVALAKQASIRIRWGDWDAANAYIRESRAHLEAARYEGIVSALIVYAVGARVAIHRGEMERGREDLVRAQLVRPLANHAVPWFSVDALLELARAYLAISDPAGAQLVLREAEQIVRVRPALGTLTDELVGLRRRLAGAITTLAGSSTLTAAELRVLPLLPTYLSFQDIADRLMISRNTVKTHAMSIYGKLWASSRGAAVERAVELGLLEPYPALQPNGASVGDQAETS